jgi:UDP-N-acetylglucosamine 4-epimerase
MTKYTEISKQLLKEPKKWLITGVAGFIGSNILEELLQLNQEVVGIDNLSTGFLHNLNEVKENVGKENFENFKFINTDISKADFNDVSYEKIDYVLHQAALGSVPRSIKDPLTSHISNVDGFLNILNFAKNSDVKSFVYASSSSVYGDHQELPKKENNIGKPLSPYAATKYINEIYAEVYNKVYSFDSIGLRYFNVFGKRQDPNGSYAAVIPKWIYKMAKNEEIEIFGDGETSRDFCFVDNAVQANILSALSPKESKNQIYNVAVNKRTTLNEVFYLIKEELQNNSISYTSSPSYKDFRQGDVRHSLADISKITKKLSYKPSHNIQEGLKITVNYFLGK